MILTRLKQHSFGRRPSMPGTISLGAVLALYCLLPGPGLADTVATHAHISQRDSILRTLLWLRTSGEYEALCLQTFNTALRYVRGAVKTPSAGNASKPPAVVMDLDETVLDTSGYSVYLLSKGLKHHEAHWLAWNQQHLDQIGLIPGAKQFIKGVESEGVHVVFVSNRQDAGRDDTMQILHKFDLATQAALDNPNGTKLLMRKQTSSKQGRRDIVNERYTVIALLGDNLNDFSDDFRSPAVDSIDERREMVRKHAADWGSRWYVLPNPIYGYWTGYIDWEKTEQYFQRPKL